MSTSIEWTDETWNPAVGCERVSPGCDNCYAVRVAHRQMQPAHVGLTGFDDSGERRAGPYWTGEVRLLPVVARPSRWGNPFLIGGNRPDVFVHDGSKVLWRTDRDDGALARAHEHATDAYRGWVRLSDDPKAKWIRAHLDELRGRDLACWCPPDLACHADVLLDLANW